MEKLSDKEFKEKYPEFIKKYPELFTPPTREKLAKMLNELEENKTNETKEKIK